MNIENSVEDWQFTYLQEIKQKNKEIEKLKTEIRELKNKNTILADQLHNIERENIIEIAERVLLENFVYPNMQCVLDPVNYVLTITNSNKYVFKVADIELIQYFAKKERKL